MVFITHLKQRITIHVVAKRRSSSPIHAQHSKEEAKQQDVDDQQRQVEDLAVDGPHHTPVKHAARSGAKDDDVRNSTITSPKNLKKHKKSAKNEQT